MTKYKAIHNNIPLDVFAVTLPKHYKPVESQAWKDLTYVINFKDQKFNLYKPDNGVISIPLEIAKAVFVEAYEVFHMIGTCECECDYRAMSEVVK